jgi:acyl-CoA synthetase (AMP-forming)/AMP-acid ligase II
LAGLDNDHDDSSQTSPRTTTITTITLETFTYKEVWLRSVHMAQRLRALAPATFAPPAVFNPTTCLVLPRTALVGILVDEGFHLPILFLAVLVAKMVILPLDPDDPVERLSLTLGDAKPSILVVKARM